MTKPERTKTKKKSNGKASVPYKSTINSGPKLDTFKLRTLKRMSNVQEFRYPIKAKDLLEINECPLCQSDLIALIARVSLKSGLTFFSTGACRNCGFVFRTISPSHSWFQKRWRQIKTGSLEPFNPEFEKIREHRYSQYLSIIKKYKTSGSLLDIGAANGYGSALLRENGFDVSCVEPEDNKASIIINKHGLPLVANDINEFLDRPQLKQYDVIIFAHCLEHLDYPIEVMRKLTKALKPNGLLYLEVPVIQNAVTWTDALYLAHKSDFDEKILTYLTTMCGFRTLETRYFRHSKKEPYHFGMVLRPAKIRPKPIKKAASSHIDKVRSLYRRNLPKDFRNYIAEILYYEINAIEQFYCTVRLDRKCLKRPDSPEKPITFEPL